MKIEIKKANITYQADLTQGISISTPFSGAHHLPRAFHAPDLKIEPVRMDDFVGSTSEGGILNFKNLFINPHGNGTHTECVGHISKEPFFIKDCLKLEHFIGRLLTISPEKIKDDLVITQAQLEKLDIENNLACLIIRTLPNNPEDKLKDWTETNPCYIHHEAMAFLVQKGIEHFMIDMPSVDREHDEGKLLAHKTFWNYPSESPRIHASITEMVYAPPSVPDGDYLVNIQILPLKMDASPSNIILYHLKKN